VSFGAAGPTAWTADGGVPGAFEFVLGDLERGELAEDCDLVEGGVEISPRRVVPVGRVCVLLMTASVEVDLAAVVPVGSELAVEEDRLLGEVVVPDHLEVLHGGEGNWGRRGFRGVFGGGWG
jgi:hypothetical protein